MKVQEITGFDVVGVATRTRNQDEMNPDTAKIAALWQTFTSQLASKLTQKSHVYGVYTHYESDHNGYYDLIVGSDALEPNIPKSKVNPIRSISVESGTYLTFSATGNMPQAAIELWQSIWAYFEAADCPHSRTYTTDFECYKQEHMVEIYIAIA